MLVDGIVQVFAVLFILGAGIGHSSYTSHIVSVSDQYRGVRFVFGNDYLAGISGTSPLCPRFLSVGEDGEIFLSDDTFQLLFFSSSVFPADSDAAWSVCT